jgi:hypothetical protein
VSKKIPPQPQHLFDVKALVGLRWQIVTEQPVPRSEAAMIVAQQWQKKSLARLVPPQIRKAA